MAVEVTASGNCAWTTSGAPAWITGQHDKIAVRVTDHPVVRDLCERIGKPLVSTSANVSGGNPATTLQEAKAIFGDAVTYVEGSVGKHTKPSVIRDGDSGEIIRG